MSEEINGKQVFSLYQVTRSIQKTIANRYTRAYWVKAELNKLNFYEHSGHCYPELVEKRDGKVVTEIRCNLWRDDFQRINKKFKHLLNEPLKDGIKILFSATINYHPKYGLSLRIIDIDPGFTLGDLEREKKETIENLHKAGIFNQNKRLQLSLLPQRIAVISVQTSKGYADFLEILRGAEEKWNYKFFHMLFPSLLQSEAAIDSIINQLENIKRVKGHFDAVAIVRGGGGDIGLSCYNDFRLNKEIAQFPLPVITGIGHATNETVVEMIAFMNAITPTKLAEFFIEKFHNLSNPILRAQENIVDRSKNLLSFQKSRLEAETKLFRSATKAAVSRNNKILNENIYTLFRQSQTIFSSEELKISTLFEGLQKETEAFCQKENQLLHHYTNSIKRDVFYKTKHVKQSLKYIEQQTEREVTRIINEQNVSLENIEINLKNLSPKNVLKRGYSVTLLNGKSVTQPENIKIGDRIETILYEGELTSTVEEIKKPEENE